MKLQFAFALLAISTATFATVRIHEELFIPGQNPEVVRELISTGSVEIDHVTSEGFELYGDKGLAKFTSLRKALNFTEIRVLQSILIQRMLLTSI